MADLSLQDSSADFEDSNLKSDRYSPSRSRSRSPLNRSRSRSRSPGRNSHNDRDRRRPNITITTKRIFVSNVPYEMKWQDLKDLFRKEVGEVAFVDMLETADGKPKGSGIIEFKDKESARRALEKMHRYKVKDRALVVREEREKDRVQLQLQKMGGGAPHNMGMNMGGGNMGGGNMGGGNMGGGNMGGGNMGNNMGGNMGCNPSILQQLGIEGPVTNSVFVSNLQYTVTWQKLKDVFKLAGNVLHAEVKKDKEGKSKGFGVVEFEHPMEAVQAISMFNNQELFGRMMRVRMDSDSPDMRPKPMALPSGLKGIGMGLGAGGVPIQNVQQMQEMMPAMSNMGSGMGGYSGNMGGFSGSGNMGNMGMPLGNMNSGMGNMGGGMGNMGTGMGNMGTGMGNMGGGGMANMGNINPSMGNTGMNMGSNMTTGMGGNMGNLGGQLSNLSANLNTNMGMGMGDNLGGTNFGTGNMGMMGSGGNLGATGGGMGDYNNMTSNNMIPGNQNMGTSNFNQNQPVQNYGGASNNMTGRNNNNIGTVSNRGRQEGCTIVAKNLPYSCTWQTLRERFREVGDVKFAEIKMDKEGKSRGLGLVRFGTPDDAQRAVNLLNRTRIDDREIDVQLDRF